VAGIALFGIPGSAAAQTATFGFTGGVQPTRSPRGCTTSPSRFSVPRVSRRRRRVRHAGRPGGQANAPIAVPREVLQIYVGGSGGYGGSPSGTTPSGGGFNGGWRRRGGRRCV
jgi:hypothetical protein